MSDCHLYRREIAGAADGGEPGRGARSHAEGCRACGDELRSRQSLRALVQGLGKVEAPADFEFRLRARIAGGEAAGGRRGPFRGMRLIYAFAPVAAAACFLVVSATLYYRQAALTVEQRPTVVASEPSREGSADAPRAGVKVEVAREPEGAGVRPLVVENDAVGDPAHTSPKRSGERVRQAAFVAAKGERVLKSARETRVYSVGAARVIGPQGVTIALRAPSEPLRMIMRDESGAGRVVPMRAVSFGAQEPLARENALRRMSVAENEGVW